MSADATSTTLSGHASAGYRTTLFSQAVRVLCKAAGVVVLARLVSPTEHGQFAMAASAFYLVVLFRDFGLSTAALRANKLSDEQLTTLWHAHLVLGVLLALIMLGLAPLVSGYYQEPRVLGLLATMSIGLLLVSFNAWPRVLLARDLRFADINRLETIAAVLGTLAMIGAAALGTGAYAFVAFLIVSEGVALVQAWRYCAWRPQAPGRWSSLRGLARTGTDLTAYNILQGALSQIDLLVMGRWFGPAALGWYNRANQLLALPAQHLSWPLAQVTLATLARCKSDSREFARHLRDAANLIAHLTLPLAAWCIALPAETIHLVLGPAWPEAAPLLRWLSLSAVASYLGTTIYALGVVTHQTRRLVAMTMLLLIASAAALWIGRSRGAEGLALALAVANLVLLIPRLWWATAGTPVRLRDYLEAFICPSVVAVIFGCGLAGGRLVSIETNVWIRSSVAGLVGTAAVVVLALAWPRVRHELTAVRKHLPFERAAV